MYANITNRCLPTILKHVKYALMGLNNIVVSSPMQLANEIINITLDCSWPRLC